MCWEAFRRRSPNPRSEIDLHQRFWSRSMFLGITSATSQRRQRQDWRCPTEVIRLLGHALARLCGRDPTSTPTFSASVKRTVRGRPVALGCSRHQDSATMRANLSAGPVTFWDSLQACYVEMDGIKTNQSLRRLAQFLQRIFLEVGQLRARLTNRLTHSLITASMIHYGDL